MANCELAICVVTDPMGDAPCSNGVATGAQAFRIHAIWIRADQADKARAGGFTVVEP